MMKKRIISLFSGSSGNATYIRCGETELLVDMGISCRALCAALQSVGTSPERIAAVFITHEHIDHVRGLDVFTKKYPLPVHIAAQSAASLPFYPGDGLLGCMHRREILFTEKVGEVGVSSFCASHDSAVCLGYRIAFPDGTACSVCTDTGVITPSVRDGMLGCDWAVLESNHDEQMLYCGPYPYELKLRVHSAHGHLSNADCAAFAADLEKAGTKGILLAHLSKENNYPPLAETTVRAAVSESVTVRAAAPDKPTVLLDEE